MPLISQIEDKYPGDKSGNADARWLTMNIYIMQSGFLQIYH